MANLRESLASTHHASLVWSPERERAIDKVAASGRCDELGVLLWKTKYMFESAAREKAEKIILEMMFKRFNFHTALLLVKAMEQAFREWLEDQCEVCGGRGHVMAGEVRIVCESCDGSRARHYTDTKRAQLMQLPMGHVEKLCSKRGPMTWTLDLMRTRDRKVNLEMNMQLERLQVIDNIKE